MYNIGGFGSSHSVVWCRLGSSASPLWKSMDLANYGFKQYSVRACTYESVRELLPVYPTRVYLRKFSYQYTVQVKAAPIGPAGGYVLGVIEL